MDNTTSIELINIIPFNPLISKCQIKVCWVGPEANRNKSIITKEVATEMANSLPGSPIVGYYNEVTEDFEEHNKIIEISNGKIKLKPMTKPYGFVDLNAKVWFQKFEDYDGITREYLVTEGWLWTGQFPECKRVIEKGNNHSMELSEEYLDADWTKNINGKREFFIINEAIISKLCILGEEFTPCFEGSDIGAPKIEFSLEEDFKQQMFSMMEEIKSMLEKGGKSMYTTYAVEIGDSLWRTLYDYLIAKYPGQDEWCSKYRIEGIYEEGGQKFAILQDSATTDYFRLNFELNEENGFAASEELVAVEKTFTPSNQFSLEDYEAFVTSYAAEKKEENKDEEICPECGKPISECTCKKDDEEEKKKDYNLDEIPEYIEAVKNLNELTAQYNELKASAEVAAEELKVLKEFKAAIDKKEKEEMINSFYMLSDEDKKDVIDNIDNYSLNDIEAKLSILCVRNRVSFNLDDDNNQKDPISYGLNNDDDSDSNMPEWVRAIKDHVAENK